ncbi:melatonin receptor type 1B-B-like [Liolophura sinensis]|uniref:melatonin receptor type 1B-B-like n=1 Tax=Liolophura sinensis TaxID=3198878 RepID=UPI003159530C
MNENESQTAGSLDSDVLHRSYHSFPGFVTVLLIVVSLCYILLGIFGNGLLIVAVFTEKKLRTRCNVFLVTLALADITIQGYVLPFSLFDYIYGRYPVGETFCKVNAFTVCYCYGLSLWSLAFIAFNRFVKICHPPKYNLWLSRRNTCLCVAILFLIPVPMNIAPFLGFGDMGYDVILHLCSYLRSGGLMYILMQMLVTVFVPAVLVLIFYSMIFYKMFTVRQKLKRVFPNPSAEYIVSKYSRHDITAAYTLLTVFILLVLLMLPYTVTTLGDVHNNWAPAIHIACLYLAYTNSWINWIIYGVMNVNIRNTYRRLLCKKRRTEHQQTEQIQTVSELQNRAQFRKISQHYELATTMTT